MNSRTRFFAPFLLLVFLTGSLPAQTVPAPAGPKPAPASAPDTFNLELQRIGGELMVRMQDLFEVIHKLDPAASLRWDPVDKVMRVDSEGKRLEVLALHPSMLINDKTRTVAHPILIRQDKVFIPVATVQILLNELGIEFDLLGGAGGEKPTPTPMPAVNLAQTTVTAPTAAATPALPAEPAVPANLVTAADLPATTTTAAATPTATPAQAAPTATPPPTPTPATVASSVIVPKINETPAAEEPKTAGAGEQAGLEPPAPLAGKISLTWGQLADLAHHHPPQRVTLLYDESLEGVAQQARQAVQESLSTEVQLLPAASAQRADAGLVGRVESTSPELVVDLIATPAGNGEDAPSMVVWAAQEALWPADQQAKATDSRETLRYRRHQFQSLALGSLLRTELGRQFPNTTIHYELAPSYLLRRLDAPAAEVLVSGGAKGGSPQAQHLAQAVAAAVVAYIQGMGKAQF